MKMIEKYEPNYKKCEEILLNIQNIKKFQNKADKMFILEFFSYRRRLSYKNGYQLMALAVTNNKSIDISNV